MTRGSQNTRIKIIHKSLLSMVNLVEKQVYESILCLKNHDVDMADIIIKNDDKVDELQKVIEEECIKFIATEQPLATDLRRIFTASKIVTDLERMADHAVDICKITKKLQGNLNIFDGQVSELWEMDKKVRDMIGLAIDAYINDDIDMAYDICKKDDDVDKLYKSLFTKILSLIQKDENLIYTGSQLLFVIKYLERVADHVTNICEWTIFQRKGVYVDLNE